VRSLAGRSQIAAKETNELIAESISRVEEGTKIATNTAASFSKIVSDFEEVSGIIGHIAAASGEQADSISQINTVLERITQAIEAGSSAIDKSNAASRQLADKATELKNMIHTV
jgi:methyl-accepting chemotaxis protein